MTTGRPYCSGGRIGIGGASLAAIVMPRSSGASAAKSFDEPQHLRRVCERPHDRSTEHHRSDRVELVLERVAIPKFPPPPRSPQSRSGSLVLVHVEPLAVGRHEVHRPQVVDRETELAHQVPEAAAERQPTDPRVADDPARRGEPEPLRRAVELSPQHPAGGSRGREPPGPPRWSS